MSTTTPDNGARQGEGLTFSYRPNFCPNCGGALPEDYHNVMSFGDPQEGEDGPVRGFDVYCDECEWSGDVCPDALDGESAIDKLADHALEEYRQGRTRDIRVLVGDVEGDGDGLTEVER